MGALLHNGDDEVPDVGIGASAILLLGYLYGRFAVDDVYTSVSADTTTATLIVRHRSSGNRHRISIVQDGTGFAPTASTEVAA